MKIPFNKPYMTGKELEYIAQAHANRHLSGNGPFTKQCQAWLEDRIGCRKALLTHSCTGALEMAAIPAGIRGTFILPPLQGRDGVGLGLQMQGGSAPA